MQEKSLRQKEELEIRELDREQLEKVFREHMIHDFPKAERKPLEMLVKMMEMGVYRCLGLYDGDHLYAYACFVTWPEQSYLLLDYLAVCREYRSGGYGSQFIRKMKSYFSDMAGIFLECESIGTAADEADQVLRSRRIDFYQRNGCSLLSIASCLYGVEYSILYLPILVHELDSQSGFDRLEEIYHLMFPDHIYEKHVKVWRTDIREV